MAEPLENGALAPLFEARTDTGEMLALESLRGKNVVLYFYPKADTPGCTTEACEFRDSQARFDDEDTVILGVSPDAPRALAKFKQKYQLPFTLLADEDHQIAESFGVWKEKSMYGKKYMGIERTTFVIDKDGRIARIFNRVKPAGHAGQVIEALQAKA
jgi:peroxiredoxin Q/BCP